MQKINASTLAALEEMLQNSTRSAPLDFLSIYFVGAHAEKQIIGHINPEFIPYIQESLREQKIAYIYMNHHGLFIENANPFLISASLTELANRLRQGGFIPGWRNEEFSWIDQNGHAYFRLERAAFRALGLRSNASHINGYTKEGNLWLGRRSESKRTDPGLLDNLAAGGISADETPWVCAVRELWEEAGVPAQLANHITPAGKVHMRRPIIGGGFHDEQLFIYDLLLTSNFIPTNHDGEVSSFIEISLAEAAARILADEFTTDAAFVTADFILRSSKSDFPSSAPFRG